MENKLIGTRNCPTCKGEGKLPEWLAPPPCVPDCAETLTKYHEGYWLCFVHTVPVPNLWRDDQRERCLNALDRQARSRKQHR